MTPRDHARGRAASHGGSAPDKQDPPTIREWKGVQPLADVLDRLRATLLEQRRELDAEPALGDRGDDLQGPRRDE